MGPLEFLGDSEVINDVQRIYRATAMNRVKVSIRCCAGACAEPLVCLARLSTTAPGLMQALAINRSNFLDHLTMDVWLRLRAFSHQRALWHNARLQMFLDLFANFGWAPDANTAKNLKLYEPVVALTAAKRVFNPALVQPRAITPA